MSVCHAPLVSQATLTVQCVLRFFSYKNVTFDRLRSEGKRGRELLSFSVFFFFFFNGVPHQTHIHSIFNFLFLPFFFLNFHSNAPRRDAS